MPQPVLTDTVLSPLLSSYSLFIPLPHAFCPLLSTSNGLSSITHYLHIVKYTLQSSKKLSATLITTDSSFLLKTLLALVMPHCPGFPLTSLPIPSPLHTYCCVTGVLNPLSSCTLSFFLAVPCIMWNFSDQGLNPHPLHWKCSVLTTGPPGKS